MNGNTPTPDVALVYVGKGLIMERENLRDMVDALVEVGGAASKAAASLEDATAALCQLRRDHPEWFPLD